MSSLHPARRSAERFNSLLDSEREPMRDARDAELLELVGALRTLPRVEARPEFVLDLRERLMLAAETDLVAADSPATLDDRLTVRTRRTPRERRLAVALGGFAIVGATTSMAVAAQTALPGDVLYPLKRAMENAETGFHVSDEAKGSTILENASGRLDEVDELTRKSSIDPVVVSQTLTEFADQASEASDLLMADYSATGSESSINDLRDFTASSIETLADLEDVIPAEAEEALLDAAKTLFEIDSLAANLCPLCESLGITEIPVPLLASNETAPDEATTDPVDPVTALVKPPKQPKPDKNPTKDPVVSTTDVPTPTVPLPTTTGDGNGTGGTSTPQNPVKGNGVSVPTSLPTVGIPVVDEVVNGVVEGVNGVLGGLASQ